MKETEKKFCAHCNSELKKWAVPPTSTWDAEYFFVCFNDECPYFVRGWERIQQTVRTHASYRYHINPMNGKAGPLPVWSMDALKDGILD